MKTMIINLNVRFYVLELISGMKVIFMNMKKTQKRDKHKNNVTNSSRVSVQKYLSFVVVAKSSKSAYNMVLYI